MLTEGQIQLRNLVMGRDTAYRALDFNPWSRQVRAAYTGDNPWSDGGYSGLEVLDTATITTRLRVQGLNAADWHQKHQALTAAFAPVYTGPDVELRWVTGGTEYLMWCRPQGVSPVIRHLRVGQIVTTGVVRCDDPLIYSGVLHETTVELGRWTGGLDVPVDVPVVIAATRIGGTGAATNNGTRAAGLVLTFEGPVTRPWVRVGAAELLIDVAIPADHYVVVDTAARTVLYDGVTSRLADASGTWPLLPPGTHDIWYGAATRYDPAALLTVQWRDTY